MSFLTTIQFDPGYTQANNFIQILTILEPSCWGFTIMALLLVKIIIDNGNKFIPSCPKNTPKLVEYVGLFLGQGTVADANQSWNYCIVFGLWLIWMLIFNSIFQSEISARLVLRPLLVIDDAESVLRAVFDYGFKFYFSLTGRSLFFIEAINQIYPTTPWLQRLNTLKPQTTSNFDLVDELENLPQDEIYLMFSKTCRSLIAPFIRQVNYGLMIHRSKSSHELNSKCGAGKAALRFTVALNNMGKECGYMAEYTLVWTPN